MYTLLSYFETGQFHVSLCLFNVMQGSDFILCLVIFVWQFIWHDFCSLCCDLGIDIAQPGEMHTPRLRLGVLSAKKALPGDAQVQLKPRSWVGSVPLFPSMRAPYLASVPGKVWGAFFELSVYIKGIFTSSYMGLLPQAVSLMSSGPHFISTSWEQLYFNPTPPPPPFYIVSDCGGFFTYV